MFVLRRKHELSSSTGQPDAFPWVRKPMGEKKVSVCQGVRKQFYFLKEVLAVGGQLLWGG